MKDTDFAKIVFLLTILAAMLFPKQGKAQKPERPDWQISTDSIPADKKMMKHVQIGDVKKDTISVTLLCGDAIRVGDSGSNKSYYRQPRFEDVLLERTLEWQRRQMGLGWLKSDWVVIETRYLENVEGCYQLTPIEKE